MNEVASYNKKDKFDRIHAHIMKGKKLGKQDAKTLEIAKIVYPLLCKGMTDRQVVKELVALEICAETMAYRHIKNTKIIFAKAGRANKEAERHILIQMAKETYRIARKKKDVRGMNGANANLIKLTGAEDKEMNLTIIYQNLTLPPLNISDDPKVIDIPLENVPFEEK